LYFKIMVDKRGVRSLRLVAEVNFLRVKIMIAISYFLNLASLPLSR
jgi:hypothetical protein